MHTYHGVRNFPVFLQEVRNKLRLSEKQFALLLLLRTGDELGTYFLVNSPSKRLILFLQFLLKIQWVFYIRYFLCNKIRNPIPYIQKHSFMKKLHSVYRRTLKGDRLGQTRLF